MAKEGKSSFWPYVGVVVVMALAVPAIGFSWFGWGLDWERASTAAKGRLVAVCVDRAQRDPDAALLENLYKAGGITAQAKIAKTAGWVPSAGTWRTTSAVSTACPAKLVELEEARKAAAKKATGG